MKKSVSRLFVLSLIASALSGCGGEKIFPTPLTDALKLDKEVSSTEKFTEPSNGVEALGEVTLSEVVDGDTFHFYNGKDVDIKTTNDISYTLRFEGVNTPESTARVEPWGVKASQFVKSILWDSNANKQKPYSVVVQNDISVYGQQDNNERYLGFVWYKMKENSDYRLLNLEVIEQCYSKNYLNAYSTFCPYLDHFIEAARTGAQSRKRVFGERDPGYDYTNAIQDVTIRYIHENFDNIGVASTDDEESSDSGIRIRVTGLILGFSGDSIFVRDVTDPYSNGEYASIYVYTALTVTAMALTYRVGQIITFVGRATKYHNNIQITDVKDITTGTADEKITVNLDPSSYGINNSGAAWQQEDKVNALKVGAEANGYHYDLMPYDKVDAFNAISDAKDFESHVGEFVKVKLTIREGDELDPSPTGDEKQTDYYRVGSDQRSYTILAKNDAGVKISIRSLYYAKGSYTYTAFEVNKAYYIIGQVAKYYDDYQITLPNKNSYSCAMIDGVTYVRAVEA